MLKATTAALALLLLLPTALGCNVTGPETAADRRIDLNISCPNSTHFQLSESPSFNEPEGVVTITVLEEDPEGRWADVAIAYPNGTSQQPDPFYVNPETKRITILAARVVFEDENGADAGIPNYFTDAYLQKLVFGQAEGHDGQPTTNSIKEHLEQNSYGRITIDGTTFPDPVRLQLSRYFDPLDLDPRNTNVWNDTLNYIEAADPDFLDQHEFDFLIIFSHEHYNVLGSLERLASSLTTLSPLEPTIKAYISSHAPIMNNSLLYHDIHDELRTAHNQTTVTTKYDISYNRVIGVWRGNDTNHTGTNYYENGSVLGPRGGRYIRLGTQLPENTTAVLVSYTPSITEQMDPEDEALQQADSLATPHSRWFARYMHELYHAISGRYEYYTFNGVRMGDLYKNPARLEWYDIMDVCAVGQLDDLLGRGRDQYYYEPQYLSGYSKLVQGFLRPLILPYEGNVDRVRIHSLGEADYADTDQRVKLVKVPLRPPNVPAYQNMLDYSGDEQYRGEEYLLLEWRSRTPFDRPKRNFEKYLHGTGLLITHVIHSPHLGSTNPPITGFGTDVVSVVDATPPPGHEEGYDDGPTTSVLFGSASGVHEYTFTAAWHEQEETNLSTKFLLSPGPGNKTVHARFKGADGTISETAVRVLLTDATADADRALSLTIAYPAQNLVFTTNPRLELERGGLNDIVETNRFNDHEPEIFQDLTGFAQIDIVNLELFTGDGAHRRSHTVYDEAGLSASADFIFYKNSMPATNQPPVADAGPDRTFNDLDGDGQATIVLDARPSSDPDGFITEYAWRDEDGLLLGTAPVLAAYRSVGVHTLTLTVTDNLGAATSDSVIVTVPGATPNQPPVAAAGSDQSVRDEDGDGQEAVTLNGSGSFDPDGAIIAYEWVREDVILGATETLTSEFPLGTSRVTLTVMDDRGTQSNDTTMITVQSREPNQPPISVIGSQDEAFDQDENGVETFTFDGDASYDPDGIILSHAWYVDGAPVATTSNFSLNLSVGNHTVLLVVTDNSSATGNATKNVQVSTLAQMCSDNEMNGDELDVDCGPICAELCDEGDLNYDKHVNVFDLVRAGSPRVRTARWTEYLRDVLINFGKTY